MDKARLPRGRFEGGESRRNNQRALDDVDNYRRDQRHDDPQQVPDVAVLGHVHRH